MKPEPPTSAAFWSEGGLGAPQLQQRPEEGACTGDGVCEAPSKAVGAEVGTGAQLQLKSRHSCVRAPPP